MAYTDLIGKFMEPFSHAASTNLFYAGGSASRIVPVTPSAAVHSQSKFIHPRRRNPTPIQSCTRIAMIPLTITMAVVWTPTAASGVIIAPTTVAPRTSPPEKHSGNTEGTSMSPAPCALAIRKEAGEPGLHADAPQVATTIGQMIQGP